MALKFRLKSKEEIPAEFSSLYVERDGGFFLDVDGAVEKSRLDEFRAHNIGLRKQLDDINQRFEGIDPDAVRGLTSQLARLEDEKLLKGGEIEKLVANRVRAALGDAEKRAVAADQQIAALTARVVETEIRRAAVEAATKLGLRPTAIADLQARAERVFKIVDGGPKALEADGKTAVYGQDGVTPLTFDEWASRQVVEAPHLFESNAGGGAVGNGSGGAAYGENPWRKETFNLTKQGEIFRKDPARARAMMEKAEKTGKG